MKKKGSALVFSVLMLSFFLAISLNIFFQARKKAERAGVRVQGERTTNNIDIASSLGYQELQLAEKFVREGFPYTDSHSQSIESYPAITSSTNRNQFYIDIATGFYTKRYSGIQLNNFIDYFSSLWEHGGTSNQKLIMGEEIVDGRVVSRMWQSAGVDSKATPLWDTNLPSGSLSIGGYSLDSTDPSPLSDGIQRKAVYRKFIRLTSSSIGDSVFQISVTESFDLTSGVVSNRSITDFTIEALD